MEVLNANNARELIASWRGYSAQANVTRFRRLAGELRMVCARISREQGREAAALDFEAAAEVLKAEAERLDNG